MMFKRTIRWVIVCDITPFLNKFRANNENVRDDFRSGFNFFRKLCASGYLQEVEYKNLGLDAIYHAEGRIAFTNGISEYQYFLKDHLGNNRILFTEENGVATVLQENHYYSFGLEMNGTWSSNNKSKYLYNGKLLDDDFGLGWYHYEVRTYAYKYDYLDRLTEARYGTGNEKY